MVMVKNKNKLYPFVIMRVIEIVKVLQIKTANLHKQFTSPEKNLGKYIEVSLSIASG